MSIDQLFNKAREKGLSDFRSDYGYDENCGKHRKLLANAEQKLRNTLTKTNDAPSYDDPFIVDAYLDTYHLQHCRLAYWVFKYLFNQFDVPNALYVCDVGAGTQAGCIGLALAPSEYKEKPAVYFDAYEPSDAMWNAGYCFWSAFRDSVGANFDPDPCSTLPHRLPDNLPDNALRVVTALHLSLPYDRNENNKEEKAQHSLEKEVQAASLDTCITMTPLLLVNSNRDFADALIDTGVEKFIAQPFHFRQGKFLAGTRDGAYDLMTQKLGCGRSDFEREYLERYRQFFGVLDNKLRNRGLPPLGEGKDRFAPPF